jgi:peptidoglycan-N-acetylglucosamine deacetylase
MLVPIGLAAAGLISYASVNSASQLWGATLAHLPAGQIALTYDDGPNDGTTQDLLQILADANVRATFFLIGRFVRQQPALAREILAQGHSIGNHTDTHPNLFWASPGKTHEEMLRCQKSIEDATGGSVRLFRPPYGFRRPDTLSLARSLGLTPAMWNVTCYDWKALTPAQIAANAERGLARNARRYRGSILLLHDGGNLALGTDRSATLAATRQLLATHPRESFVAVT